MRERERKRVRERSKVQFYSESKTLFSSKIKKKEIRKKRFASMVKGGVVHLKKTCFAPILRQIIFYCNICYININKSILL